MTAPRCALARCPSCGGWTPDAVCSDCAGVVPLPDLYVPHRPVIMPAAAPRRPETHRDWMRELLHASDERESRDAVRALHVLRAPVARD